MDNVRMDVRGIGCRNVDWMHLAQDKDQWLAFVDTLMDLGSINGGNFLTG
jgi:hypothetical protein